MSPKVNPQKNFVMPRGRDSWGKHLKDIKIMDKSVRLVAFTAQLIKRHRKLQGKYHLVSKKVIELQKETIGDEAGIKLDLSKLKVECLERTVTKLNSNLKNVKDSLKEKDHDLEEKIQQVKENQDLLEKMNKDAKAATEKLAEVDRLSKDEQKKLQEHASKAEKDLQATKEEMLQMERDHDVALQTTGEKVAVV